jgi:hypothetical protein
MSQKTIGAATEDQIAQIRDADSKQRAVLIQNLLTDELLKPIEMLDDDNYDEEEPQARIVLDTCSMNLGEYSSANDYAREHLNEDGMPTYPGWDWECKRADLIDEFYESYLVDLQAVFGDRVSTVTFLHQEQGEFGYTGNWRESTEQINIDLSTANTTKEETN